MQVLTSTLGRKKYGFGPLFWENVATPTLLGVFPELPSNVGILLGCVRRGCT